MKDEHKAAIALAIEFIERDPQTGTLHYATRMTLRDMLAEDPADDLMNEAWDLTTRDRHNQYGSAEDAFRAYGHIWTGLLQHKLRDEAVIDATDVCLMMTGLKIAREVRNSKRDNVVDAHGYLSLLSRIRGWVSRR
jgi:hypothetical protein